MTTLYVDEIQKTIGRLLGPKATERDSCPNCGSYNYYVEEVYTKTICPYPHLEHLEHSTEYSHLQEFCNDCGYS